MRSSIVIVEDDDFDSETLPSYRSRETSPPNHGCDTFGLADIDEEDAQELHHALYEHDRNATILVKDAHDVDGSGMTFTLGLNASFKHAFDAFKAASCKTCRSDQNVRFKVSWQKLKNEDTPTTIKSDILHAEIISIKAFSNTPGLGCKECKKTGYPTTRGTTYDANFPIPTGAFTASAATKKLLRVIFQDPNGKLTAIPVTNTYHLKHAMGDYAQRAECHVRSLHFFFDGEEIAEDDTAEELKLGMQNNSVVEVFMHSMGA